MPQLRISSGIAKNKKLKAPKIPGFRAVQEVAKSAAFSIIEQDSVTDANCLDLYTGSGNMGIEALSRGAAWCDFVDKTPQSERVVGENLKNCGFAEKGAFYQVDAVKYAAETPNKYNLIFVDPFYTDTSHRFLLKNLAEILETDGWVVFTHGKDLDMQSAIEGSGLSIYTQRKYGASFLSVLRKVNS